MYVVPANIGEFTLPFDRLAHHTERLTSKLMV